MSLLLQHILPNIVILRQSASRDEEITLLNAFDSVSSIQSAYVEEYILKYEIFT